MFDHKFGVERFEKENTVEILHASNMFFLFAEVGEDLFEWLQDG